MRDMWYGGISAQWNGEPLWDAVSGLQIQTLNREWLTDIANAAVDLAEHDRFYPGDLVIRCSTWFVTEVMEMLRAEERYLAERLDHPGYTFTWRGIPFEGDPLFPRWKLLICRRQWQAVAIQRQWLATDFNGEGDLLPTVGQQRYERVPVNTPLCELPIEEDNWQDLDRGPETE